MAMVTSLWVILLDLFVGAHYVHLCSSFQLRFRPDGRFKILQVADMHYANGGTTECKDVLKSDYESCSDLNTTAFITRLIKAENPDLIVFSGDNIFGQDTIDPISSLNAAFAPAIKAQIPWVAILGNHDQESRLSRREVMEKIVNMDYTLSQVYPFSEALNSSMVEVDGFGNYHLEIGGALSSPFENKSVLNLFLLDSGDYSKVSKIQGYGWIQETQKKWFKELSASLQEKFQSEPTIQSDQIAPALVYFHIPLVEARQVGGWWSITGVQQESIGCAEVNSGFLATMRETKGSHIVFNGHDHVNDFCGDLPGEIKMCYGGGVGYHAYGKTGWARRARIVEVSLHTGDELTPSNVSSTSNHESIWDKGQQWLGVDQILTWKRLDKPSLTIIDHEILWSRTALLTKNHNGWDKLSLALLVLICIYLLAYFSSSWWPFDRMVPFSMPRRHSHAYIICEA